MRVPLIISAAAASVLGCLPVDDPDAPPPPDAPPSTSFAFQALEANGPAPRWGSLITGTPTGAFIFGGAALDLLSGQGTLLRDLWRVEVDDTRVQFFDASVGGGPDPRYCGCAGYDATRNELVVLGGRADLAKRSAFVLDIDEARWTEVSGDVPPGSVGCSIAFVPGTSTAYTFGGGNDFSSFGDTWKFDGATRTFTQLDIAGPSPRYDHVVKVVDDSAFLLVAGALNAVQGFSSEVWRFDVAAESWTQLGENTADGPSGRRTPWVALATDTSRLLMGFGVNGMDDDSDLADLWEFDLAAGTWTRADVDGELPPSRGFASWLPGPPGTAGLLWSGTDMEHTLEDAWLLAAPEGTSWR